MSKKRRSRAAARRRGRRIGTGTWALIAGAAVILGLVGFNLWQSGTFADAPAPVRLEDVNSLPPLSEAGQPLSGGYDAARIPAATPLPQAAPEGAVSPRVELPAWEHDFGPISSRQNVVRVFAVQNVGTADLVISDIVTSCGCTTAELSSDVIPPGQRADLTVTFDPDFHETQGNVVRVVWFTTNDPSQPMVEVRISAYVQ